MIIQRFRSGMMLGAAILVAQLGYSASHTNVQAQQRIEREVRRELIALPSYSLFDHFTFRVDGDTVTLMGKVSQPTLKTDAERVAKRIEGIRKVTNQIEVLPLSASDDHLRRVLYESIYGHSALQTLAVRAVPPIHIIVDNGTVTLEGVVANELQKNVARVQANSVAGVFVLTNNLRVERSS